MIDHNTVQKILDSARIEEVVGDFVSLRRRGVNLIGLCPFHSEKTPSFTVSPAKNICHCFGCGNGIEIVEKEESAEDLARRSSRENMFALNAFALKYFSNTLNNTEEGRSIGIPYFRERGFRDDTIKKFQLGYCPDRFEAVSVEALKEGFSRQTLIDTGLCTENQRGGLTDRFRGRVIFPVHTVSGQVVAFGGRVLKKTEKNQKSIIKVTNYTVCTLQKTPFSVVMCVI